MPVVPGTDAAELPGCAPHTSTSKTTEYFLKPGHASGKEAIDLCEREAAVFAHLSGDHRIPDGAMCICNPYLPDCPLTFANATFCKQTGYSIEEIIGRNCRFLQCSESNRDVIKAMGDCFKTFQKRRRPGIHAGARTFRIVNAKKDGTRFLNMVHMAPLYDRNDTLVRILGVQYGLECIASSDFNRIFQGVITPDSTEYTQSGDSTSDCLAKWGGWKPVSQVGVASQEQSIAHMQEIMTACINSICKLVDYDRMELIATAASQRVACTLAVKRPFECEAGGPHGRPMQGMVAPGRKRRTVALAHS